MTASSTSATTSSRILASIGQEDEPEGQDPHVVEGDAAYQLHQPSLEEEMEKLVVDQDQYDDETLPEDEEYGKLPSTSATATVHAKHRILSFPSRHRRHAMYVMTLSLVVLALWILSSSYSSQEEGPVDGDGNAVMLKGTGNNSTMKQQIVTPIPSQKENKHDTTNATANISNDNKKQIQEKKETQPRNNGNEKKIKQTLMPVPHYYPPTPKFSQTVKLPGFNDFWLVASKAKSLAVNIIPKVMCSSIRESLNPAECHYLHMAPNAVHDDRCAEARMNHAVSHYDLRNMTRVIFFRDPLERAYSAYRNSDTNPHISTPHCPAARNCSFDKWVNELLLPKFDTFQNEHFKPQSVVAQFDKFHYHYKLRMSSPADQQFFWHSILQQPELHKNDAGGAVGVVDKVRQEFEGMNMTTLDKLATLYHEDITMWKSLLDEGTPRQEGEATLYDFYRQAKNKENDNPTRV